jgi:beta-phosphoglucomutase-like phosphatase (HAD superfamily)
MDQNLLKLVDQRLNLSALFENKIYTLDKVGYRSKPNPDIFLYAAQQLGSLPESCVVIEDAPHGIDAAKRAGMRCIAISTTYDAGKLEQADFVVNAYAEIDLDAVNEQAPIRDEPLT